jgi:type 1 fimbria pilin
MNEKLKTTCSRLLAGGILMSAGLLLSTTARAEVHCSATDENPPEIQNVTLNGTFYVGNDLPNGSVLYRTTAHNAKGATVQCDDAFSLGAVFGIGSEPSGAPFSQAGAPYNGQIYPTNVKGIGVAVWVSGQAFTQASPSSPPLTMSLGSAGASTFGGLSFDISLIKTGSIDSGAVVDGNSLPQAIFYVIPSPGYSGLPLTLWTVNFNGEIHFTTQTCQTPDVNVEMGSYDKSKYFHGVGSTTQWIDSSIRLKNCPTFSGYHDGRDESAQSITGSGTPSGGGLASNILKVSLQPATDIIDDANGIIGVNANGTSGTAATGIGIQIGYSPDKIDADPTSPTSIWRNGDTWMVLPPTDGSKNLNIPMAARYYQVNKTVTAGPANSQVTFLISYQ